MAENNNKTNYPKNLWSGLLFGIGLVAFIDEAVFHQLLHWHHFYDKSTTGIGDFFMPLVGLLQLDPYSCLPTFAAEVVGCQ